MFQMIAIVMIALALLAAYFDVAVAFAAGLHVSLHIPLGIAGIAVFIVGTRRRN